jgi:hypothetical protein
VIVRFVDIGGIVDRHCLNFLFIIVMATSKYINKKIKTNNGNHSEIKYKCPSLVENKRTAFFWK